MFFFLKVFSSKIIAKQDFKLQRDLRLFANGTITSEVNYIRALTHSSYTKSRRKKRALRNFWAMPLLIFVLADVLYFRMEGKRRRYTNKSTIRYCKQKNLNKVGKIGIKKISAS